MALEIKSQNVALNGNNTSFNFDYPVTQYLAGIASFKLSYGDDDHYVEQMSIQLTANQPSSQLVTVGAIAVLQDASGHSIDISSSYVTVTVIAWTGSSNYQVLLSPVSTVPNGSQSAGITLPSTSNTILQSIISGFYLNYGNTDHEVAGIAASVGVTQNQNTGYISATATMNDASGNQAENPTATGALIASSSPTPGFVVVPYQGQSSDAVSINMSTPITAAVSFLTGFKVKYPSSDHYIQTIGAGPNVTNVDSNNSSYARTSGVWAWMNDINGHSQDNDYSSASIIVIGLTE